LPLFIVAVTFALAMIYVRFLGADLTGARR